MFGEVIFLLQCDGLWALLHNENVCIIPLLKWVVLFLIVNAPPYKWGEGGQIGAKGYCSCTPIKWCLFPADAFHWLARVALSNRCKVSKVSFYCSRKSYKKS